MKSYEVRIYRDGSWKVHSCYDDRESAIEEARRLDSAGRHSAISVVEEDQDPFTNALSSRTIFRDQAFEQANQDRLDQSRRERAERRMVESEREHRRRKRFVRKIQTKRRQVGVRLVLVSAGVIFCSLIGLAGLQYLREILWNML